MTRFTNKALHHKVALIGPASCEDGTLQLPNLTHKISYCSHGFVLEGIGQCNTGVNAIYDKVLNDKVGRWFCGFAM
jgi:hypothetical protein